jgi:hypothetical protein
VELVDRGWPGPPDLASATPLTDDQIAAQRAWLKGLWPSGGHAAPK